MKGNAMNMLFWLSFLIDRLYDRSLYAIRLAFSKFLASI
jgi:hypothetical protein